mmetsp:Transcript_109957/g.355064  ORF Transcript_109957/g.355064 Transcript_109957/m.355064 type:complete len:213 (+) Transcript_109957:72-710(+)
MHRIAQHGSIISTGFADPRRPSGVYRALLGTAGSGQCPVWRGVGFSAASRAGAPWAVVLLVPQQLQCPAPPCLCIAALRLSLRPAAEIPSEEAGSPSGAFTGPPLLHHQAGCGLLVGLRRTRPGLVLGEGDTHLQGLAVINGVVSLQEGCPQKHKWAAGWWHVNGQKLVEAASARLLHVVGRLDVESKSAKGETQHRQAVEVCAVAGYVQHT